MSTIVKRTLPRGVIALGLVSLFMDTSSELIHSLLPAFMVSVLGLNILTIGLIEGMPNPLRPLRRFLQVWSAIG